MYLTRAARTRTSHESLREMSIRQVLIPNDGTAPDPASPRCDIDEVATILVNPIKWRCHSTGRDPTNLGRHLSMSLALCSSIESCDGATTPDHASQPLPP